MNKKRAMTNIIVGMIFKVVLLGLTVISKSFVVRYLGDEVNGLYSLYVSIMGFLTIANLGVGSAITYSMYQPIVEKDIDAVSSLYYLYKKFYFYIMIIILVVGLLITPIVPYLAKGNSDKLLIYKTYIVFLISVTLTYLYAHKITLINAYKDNYLTTFVSSMSLIIEGVIQIIILVVFKNFFYFLLIRIFAYIIEGTLIEIVFRKKYKNKINDNRDMNSTLKKEVIKNSSAKMYAEIGSRLISTFDGIIISFFVGVIALGNYSNYLVIITGLYTLLALIFSEVTSIVGELYIKNTKEKYHKQFEKSFLINFIVGLIFFLGYISISHNIVEIIFSIKHVEKDMIVIALAANYYVNYLRRSIVLFKNSSGVFYEDRHRPLIEGIVNIILSIIFVNFLGVSGVLIATIITRLLISYTWEPYVLFEKGFEKSPKNFYKTYYSSVIIFMIVSLLFLQIPFKDYNNPYINLLIRGSVSVLVSGVVLILIYIFYKPFREILNQLIKESIELIKGVKKQKKKNNL